MNLEQEFQNYLDSQTEEIKKELTVKMMRNLKRAYYAGIMLTAHILRDRKNEGILNEQIAEYISELAKDKSTISF